MGEREMKILILEDNEEWIVLFKEMFRQSYIRTCKDVDEAIKALSAEDFLVIFFDHDLDGEVEFGQPHKNNTGYRVAAYLVEHKLQKEAYCVVHSMNPCGSKAIFDLLANDGYSVKKIPFNKIREEYEARKHR
jgi:hypothetical protein